MNAEVRKQVDLQGQMEYFALELKRTGVTRLLLWKQYLRQYPQGFGYSQFCKYLVRFLRITHRVMHFQHEPGKIVMVDFAGDKMHYVDTYTGELIQ